MENVDKKVIESNAELHQEIINVMSQFFDDGKPKVGVFWFNYIQNTLFGVQKFNADKYVNALEFNTLLNLYKAYWQKQHQRAVAKEDTKSMFYLAQNYKLIPKGLVLLYDDGSMYVAVGNWINTKINGQSIINQQAFREAIADEFNIPDDFELTIDIRLDMDHNNSDNEL